MSTTIRHCTGSPCADGLPDELAYMTERSIRRATAYLRLLARSRAREPHADPDAQRDFRIVARPATTERLLLPALAGQKEQPDHRSGEPARAWWFVRVSVVLSCWVSCGVALSGGGVRVAAQVAAAASLCCLGLTPRTRLNAVLSA